MFQSYTQGKVAGFIKYMNHPVKFEFQINDNLLMLKIIYCLSEIQIKIPPMKQKNFGEHSNAGVHSLTVCCQSSFVWKNISPLQGNSSVTLKLILGQ